MQRIINLLTSIEFKDFFSGWCYRRKKLCNENIQSKSLMFKSKKNKTNKFCLKLFSKLQIPTPRQYFLARICR